MNGDRMDGGRRVKRLIVAMAVCLATALTVPRSQAAPLDSPPPVTLFGLHPSDSSGIQVGPDGPTESMHIQSPNRKPGAHSAGGQVAMPQAFAPKGVPDKGVATIERSGTGFFIGPDGTLLTAAHVISGCSSIQIVSKYLPRLWVSVLAADLNQDLALLRTVDTVSTSFVRLAINAPTSNRLLVLGFPANAGMTDPAESWVALENQKFPPKIGPLANPRAMLWMSAPLVTYGFSGGPIFDPSLDAVVGVVKGQVDGGYLRLLRDMPTSGIVIGPGSGDIGSFLKEEARYTPASAAAVYGEAGLAMVKRATVHVMCWR